MKHSDKDRLDWITRMGVDVGYARGLKTWGVSLGVDGKAARGEMEFTTFKGDTPREAIDAAMSAEPPAKGRGR